MKRLIVASHNRGKIKEYEYMLNHLEDMGIRINSNEFNLILASDIDTNLVFPEETGSTYEENAMLKAKNAYDDLLSKKLLKEGDIVFGDDTGLEIKEIPNELGLYSARFLGESTPQSERNKEVIKRLNDGDKDRSARFICTIAYIENDKKAVVTGIVEGSIAKEIDEGNNGFGYDPIFIPCEYDKTFSSCTTLEKIKVSHRGKAFGKMISMLGEKTC